MKLWVFAPLRAAALSGFKVGVSALCLALCFACGGCLRQAASAEWKEPVTGMQFVLIPPGRFVMGSPVGEAQREEQERQHETVITRAFYLGKFEVTQRQWEAVMGDNPSHFREAGGELPVERVTWYDVQEFLKRLSATGGVRYRLPTEAEWEYACRAGATTAYSGGETLTTAEANFDGRNPAGNANSGEFRGRTTKVGSFAPNRWGLHDLHGNVWEWTQDRHCPYPTGTVADPLGNCAGEFMVIRGGSWYFNVDSARCALRYTHRPQDRGFSLGFRVARDLN